MYLIIITLKNAFKILKDCQLSDLIFAESIVCCTGLFTHLKEEILDWEMFSNQKWMFYVFRAHNNLAMPAAS